MSELTPTGRGGVSVLRLSGPGVRERVARLSGGVLPGPEGIALVRLCEKSGELVDEALLLELADECLELHLQGSPPVLRRVKELLGELSEAPRMGLEQRAWAALAAAPAEAVGRILLDQAEGAFRRELWHLALTTPIRWRHGLCGLRECGRILRLALAPPRVVLAGPVNAGKSTLFNSLLGRERAITSADRGTTRDVLAERAMLGNYAVELVDTAGERGCWETEAADGLESAGQALGRQAQARADLVLWLDPFEAPMPASSHGVPVVHLASRAAEHGKEGGESLSTLEDPSRARSVVEEAFHSALGLPREPWRRGRGVPFDSQTRRLVDRLLEDRSCRASVRSRALALRAALPSIAQTGCST